MGGWAPFRGKPSKPGPRARLHVRENKSSSHEEVRLKLETGTQTFLANANLEQAIRLISPTTAVTIAHQGPEPSRGSPCRSSPIERWTTGSTFFLRMQIGCPKCPNERLSQTSPRPRVRREIPLVSSLNSFIHSSVLGALIGIGLGWVYGWPRIPAPALVLCGPSNRHLASAVP